jgi:hypothetical protein
VQNILKKSKMAQGLENKPRTGRPSLLSVGDIRNLVIESKKFPTKTAAQLRRDCGLQNCVSVDTVKRALRKSGLFGRVAMRKPLLTVQHKRRRLLWCQARRAWTVQDWKKIVFTDECKLELHPRARQYVRRPVGSALKEKYLSHSKKYSPSVMVWGAVRGDGKRILLKCDENVDAHEYQRILAVALPQIYNTRYLLQQDGASCHTARSTALYLQRKGVRMLPLWPAQSPDLNLIENLWHLLKGKVRERNPKDIGELWQVAMEERDAISSDMVMNLYASMPRRVKAVLASKGGSTKY